MSNALARRDANIDPFANYRRDRPRVLIGQRIKFVKGRYLTKDNTVVPAGTRLVAIMRLLTIGWQKWVLSTCVDSDVGLYAEGFRLRPRPLDDRDETLWEVVNGKLRDPWQRVKALPVCDPASEALYTFVTSSAGGIGAIDDLFEAYGKRHANLKHALIELGVSEYWHKDRTIGQVLVPVFKLVGLVDDGRRYDALLDAASNAVRPAIEAQGPPAPRLTVTGGLQTPPAAVEGGYDGIDDDIPF
jgi:hypothetical protein